MKTSRRAFGALHYQVRKKVCRCLGAGAISYGCVEADLVEREGGAPEQHIESSSPSPLGRDTEEGEGMQDMPSYLFAIYGPHRKTDISRC